MGNNVNKTVKIVKSTDLIDLKLTELVGRKAVITEQLTQQSRKNKGFKVKLLEGKFQGEIEWFIPKSSIQIIQNFR